MKKILSLTLVVLMATMTGLFAQSTKKKSAERLVKVGCVDFTRVFDSIPQKKEIESKLAGLQAEYEKKQGEKEKELNALLAEYTNNRGNMNKNQITEMNTRIATLRIELHNLIQEANEKLAAQEDVLLQPVLRNIKNVVREKSIQYGFSMILDKSTYVVYVEKDLDITDDVIEEINKQTKESKKDEERR
jgi:outer membrane protein